MKLKFRVNPIVFLLFLTLFSFQKSLSQCFQIESILVAACGTPEGHNEMVRFKVGSTALNVSTLDVDWPNNNWGGLIKNATTASKVAAMNANILDEGGCGQLLEPPSTNIIPAGASVVLVTSHQMSTGANPFGALTETIYILFQNSTATAGHFANYNASPGLRTLTMSFAGGCSDTVTYDRTLLSNAMGATVLFTDAGAATYVNYGCSAPVTPFTVDAGAALSGCAGSTVSLAGTASGQQSVNWTAPSGTFSNSANLSNTFTIPSNATGQIVLTLAATNSCGSSITDTVTLTVTPGGTPTFNLPTTICNGSTPPTLPTTSTNGITGTWSPSVVSNTTGGSYLFTPATGQCATPFTLNVTVTNSITPTFNLPTTICNGTTAPTLPTTSTNGITGTWSPNVVSNTTGGSYVFTPNAGQCGTTFTLNVTVTNSITPTFNLPTTICSGTTAPTLPITSTNNITGTWSPNVVSNTTGGSYVFTPNAGQCGTTFTLTVTVTNSITPTFSLPTSICNGGSTPPLPTTSTNGVTGTWAPAVMSNTTSGTYVFTPNAGQCATTFTWNVTVINPITPTFNLPTTLCNGTVAPTLPTTSTNSITGTWAPAVMSNTANGSYVFTPNAGQCAASFTLNVAVTSPIVPTFNLPTTLCSGTAAPALPMTSTNNIAGTWSPAVINNTADGSYVFTPNAGQCGTSFTLNVTISNSITPVFTIVDTFCNGATAPTLPTTSNNGITGSWAPAVVNNTANGTYVFTPNAGQCGTVFMLNVTVTPKETPDFATSLTICSGQTAPVLNATSPNGVSGTWNPSVIDTAASGAYVFTPNAGQCAESVTLQVTVSTFAIGFDQRCVAAEYIVTAIPVNNSFDPATVSYLWKNEQGAVVGTNDETLNISDLMNLSTITFPATFQVTISNAAGCTDTESVVVSGAFCTIPKGISPNGDNANDSFDLTGLGVDEIKIFNRYGTEVFSQRNYTNQWMGQTNKGDELPDATYFYVIHKNNGETVTGWVYVNR